MSESTGLHHLKFLYQRFFTSTMGWPEDAQMGYLKLLTVQFERGGIPDDLKEIAAISPAAKKHWRRIKPKFRLRNEEGLLYNLIMDGIRKEAVSAYTSSVENGKKGGRPKKPKAKPAGLSGDNPDETGGFLPENPTLNLPGNPEPNPDERQPITNNQIKEKVEKENWDQYPTAETELSISNAEVQVAIEFLFRMGKPLLTSERVLDFWAAFRLNLAGEFYQTRGRLIQHFRNWLKDRDLDEMKISSLKTGESATERYQRELREKIIGA